MSADLSLPGAPPGPTGSGWRARVQQVGGNLAGMVMPNIGAFIAWGLLTALFIPTGWIPNENLEQLVGPTITFLLPLLIGYTGGRLVHGQRGAVIGAIAVMGVIVGADIPQFLAAMIFGPLAAWVLKQFDAVVQPRIRSGFEMLVNNFSLGILGFVFALVGFLAIGPVMENGTEIVSNGVEALVEARLLPLVSLIVEPAKVLFLNNALNHGVFSAIGVVEAREAGQSVLFMLETNPGPGLGILLAFWMAGPRVVRPSVPGAAIIHFFGGIHEIYFPYVLMKPKMIFAAIAGGMAGVTTFMLTGAGLTATPSPGSIFAYIAVTPRGGYLPWILGMALSAVVSFVVGVALLRLGNDADEEITTDVLDAAVAQSQAAKAESKAQVARDDTASPATSGTGTAVSTGSRTIAGSEIRRVIVACEAGMGSSVLLTTQMKKRLEPYGVDVEHSPVNRLTDDAADVVLCHKGLVNRARQAAPTTVVVPFETFLGDPAFDRLEAAIRDEGTIDG